MSKSMYIDNSKDLLIQHHDKGVQLIRPEKAHHSEESATLRVGDFLEMPFCVYFMDTQSVLKNVNGYSARSCGFISATDAIGRSARDIATKESAEMILKHDKMVLEQKKMIVQDEPFQQLEDGIIRPSVAFKFPLLNEEQDIIGLFGCSIVLNDKHHSFASALNVLIQSGLLTPKIHQPQARLAQKPHFTARELEILTHLVNKKSAKEIGKILTISYRTVEDYTEKLKLKMNAKNKMELIKMAKIFLLD